MFMKGTYDDGTEFYLELFKSKTKKPNRGNFLNNKDVIKIPYDTIDGITLDGDTLDELSGMLDYMLVEPDIDTIKGTQLHMNLCGWRKIKVNKGAQLKDRSHLPEYIIRAYGLGYIVECIASVRFDLENINVCSKIEQAFASETAKNWSIFNEHEKRVALCFLERYVLPFEAVKYFSHTGKLDMSSFEETYGRNK